MQTTFPKIAAVLLSMCAVAFMGMSIAAYYGRPDPISEMLAPELKNYNFQASTTPAGTSWTVTGIEGDRTPKQHDNAYKAIVAAYQAESQRLSTSTQQKNDLAAQFTDRLAIVLAEQKEDVAAVETQIGSLTQILNSMTTDLDNRSKALEDLFVQTTAVRDETTQRRQDVTRLQNELEELRTDKFRLEEIRRVLTDRLVRLQLENQELEIRMKQLHSTTGANTDDANAVDAEAGAIDADTVPDPQSN